MNQTVTIAGSDIQFSCAPEQSLLDAAAQAGIELPYSCRKGVCGNCAGRVLDGTVAGVAGAALHNAACAPDQVLFCHATALSPLVIAPQSWHRLDPDARKTLAVKVYRNDLLAPDVSLLQLRLPAGQRLRFRAGQYLQLHLDDSTTRSYSMANAPHESDAVTLHIRHVPGGIASQRVPQLAKGDMLTITLPFGNFQLHDDGDRPMVCVAGGTGFAPIKSLLDDMVKRKIHRPVTLIWGARDDSGIYLMSAVARWSKLLPQFHFVPAISHASQSTLDGAHLGMVHEALAHHVDSLQEHDLYCCGSPAMVAAVRQTACQNLALPPERFHADVFVPGGAG